jgi:hypothetical protein
MCTRWFDRLPLSILVGRILENGKSLRNEIVGESRRQFVRLPHVIRSERNAIDCTRWLSDD